MGLFAGKQERLSNQLFKAIEKMQTAYAELLQHGGKTKRFDSYIDKPHVSRKSI